MSSDEITISWTPGSNESAWDIQWGPTGFTPSSNTTIDSAIGISTNSYTITGLNQGTSYDIYVQADCPNNETPFWGLPFTQTTSCSVVTQLPWIENFDDLTNLGDSILPHCWLDENGAFTSQNGVTLGNAASLPNNIFIRWSENDYLWTPLFHVTAGKQYQLSFSWKDDSEMGWLGRILYNNMQSNINAITIDTFVNASENAANTFQRATICFTAPTTDNITFGIHIISATNVTMMDFDDFMVKEASQIGTDSTVDVCQTDGLVD